MAVALSDRIAVPIMALTAQLVGTPNRAVGGLAMALQPRTKGWTEIEVQRLIIVAHIDDRPLHDVCLCVGDITFTENALIPVREGRGAWLVSNNSGPRTLARRLIEM